LAGAWWLLCPSSQEQLLVGVLVQEPGFEPLLQLLSQLPGLVAWQQQQQQQQQQEAGGVSLNPAAGSGGTRYAVGAGTEEQDMMNTDDVNDISDACWPSCTAWQGSAVEPCLQQQLNHQPPDVPTVSVRWCHLFDC
jgi:hypothetical protein